MRKSDFTPDNLANDVKNLASSPCYQSPLPNLGKLLEEVKKFDDHKFTCDFYLNMYQQFKYHAALFWCDSHKKDIVEWLKEAPIITDVFDTTFDDVKPPRPLNPKNEHDAVRITFRLIGDNKYYAKVLIHSHLGATLDRLQIEPKEAIECIEKSKKSFAPAMLENVITPLSNKLAELEYLQRFETAAAALTLKSQTAQPKKPASKISYQWKDKPETELPELYNLMVSVKYELIAPDTTLEQFMAIFTGQPIQNITPIKWISTNALLAYFLDKVFEGQNWQSIAGSGIFLNAKGKLLNSNDLAQAKKKITDWSKPKDYKKIDTILTAIKKHS
ncbi:hypothetical protein SAMN05421780_111148 [Flexibacter flexilis DSM 6793]|uniref:Uncharacterized protein n=1 Tax=Flexibacter flexilis DSM 6793 TaxID=927664 RepID=A0A1I1MX57_9BACT|nr:hypothetical protein [Flexibacter flexilis]SFC89696.1 hypothetical protein SAMN05421780_111148 [Flexibacter flexilis DSM 6793]